jgi:hypothetical protein
MCLSRLAQGHSIEPCWAWRDCEYGLLFSFLKFLFSIEYLMILYGLSLTIPFYKKSSTNCFRVTLDKTRRTLTFSIAFNRSKQIQPIMSVPFR